MNCVDDELVVRDKYVKLRITNYELFLWEGVDVLVSYYSQAVRGLVACGGVDVEEVDAFGEVLCGYGDLEVAFWEG